MKKIYLIDDDEDDQFFFKETIKSINSDIKCCIANNGKIAFDYLKTTTSFPDIVFLDLNMPVMNGFEFLKNLQSELSSQNLLVGIYSTTNDDNEKKIAKSLGAKFFLTKPTDIKLLYKKVKEILFTDFSKVDHFVIA